MDPFDNICREHSPDTPAAFSSNIQYGSTAALTGTLVNFPTLVGLAATGTNTSALAPPANFMRWYNMPSYDYVGCSNYCTATTGCKAFNMCTLPPLSTPDRVTEPKSTALVFHRTPSITPSLDPTSTCYNPNSTVQIRCALWSAPITLAQMTPPSNQGELRGGFTVLTQGKSVECSRT